MSVWPTWSRVHHLHIDDIDEDDNLGSKEELQTLLISSFPTTWEQVTHETNSPCCH